MNEKESQILALINENPFISQNDLSDRLGLSRSAIAGYISSLTKQGKLLGRAYVLPQTKDVLCVGGANVDRKIQVLETLLYGTSNPAQSSQSAGGVARNIAENLGRLGCKTGLLTVVGDDQEGAWLLDYTKAFSDISATQTFTHAATGSYTAVLDQNGSMAVAFADMSICNSVDWSCIDKKWGHFKSARMVVLDTNFPPDVLEKIIRRCEEENIPICISPVSSPKVKNLPGDLKGVTWLIANKDEAEALTGIEINSEGEYYKAAEMILKKGVKKVVITRGDKGLIYFTESNEAGALLPPEVNVLDVTGAGDSLVAGVIYGELKGLNTDDACRIGMTCSMLTLQSCETVSPELDHKQLLEAYKKYFR